MIGQQHINLYGLLVGFTILEMLFVNNTCMLQEGVLNATQNWGWCCGTAGDRTTQTL